MLAVISRDTDADQRPRTHLSSMSASKRSGDEETNHWINVEIAIKA